MPAPLPPSPFLDPSALFFSALYREDDLVFVDPGHLGVGEEARAAASGTGSDAERNRRERRKGRKTARQSLLIEQKTRNGRRGDEQKSREIEDRKRRNGKTMKPRACGSACIYQDGDGCEASQAGIEPRQITTNEVLQKKTQKETQGETQ